MGAPKHISHLRKQDEVRRNPITRTYIAHSENNKGEIQTMTHHSLGVAQFMKEFVLSEKFSDLYEFCGLTHDIGKYSNEFQRFQSKKQKKFTPKKIL